MKNFQIIYQVIDVYEVLIEHSTDLTEEEAIDFFHNAYVSSNIADEAECLKHGIEVLRVNDFGERDGN
jgi:hypothetical protein